ncbi:MAG: peptide chain release factor N(5)-glutamine methyltransferase [Clostridia bacterium]|nr:peptide chain release factor N(5)-glutamine methyltransferase [Clostridia bacterium]
MKLSELRRRLTAAGVDEPATEARLLFAAFSGATPAEMLGCDPECEEPALADALLRRCAREPLAYILGEVPFYRSTLRVTPDCLIPRSDTERLVELAVDRLPHGAVFLDLCTGSGAIAVTVLAERTDTCAVATDISEGALAVAAENARRLGVADRLTLLRSDLLSETPEGEFCAILSNPPYIRTAVVDTLSPEVGREPRSALDGGRDGLLFYRRILTLAPLLRPHGFFLLECGYDQEEEMAALASRAGLSFSPYRDYGGRFRGCLLTP